MRDWLPEDHLVWFVVGLVERLDLSELERVYRLGAQGRAAYDPAMMLSLLVWAAIEGVRSSRRIERACRQDAAFRVICGTGGAVPDHTTICRFRQDHEAAILGLFVQVLVICDQLGLLPLGDLAVDGTKVQANAALDANRRLATIRAQAAEILAAMREADEADEAVSGQDSPGAAARLERRLVKLEAAIAAAQEMTGTGDETTDDTGGEARSGGSRESGDVVVNVTDPDSRMMHDAHGGSLQGYNAQVAASEGGVIVGALVTNRRNDKGLLSVMLAVVMANLAAAGVDRRPGAVLADAGYFVTGDLARIDDLYQDLLVLVATDKRHRQPTEAPPDLVEVVAAWRAEQDAIDAEVAAEQARRAAIFARVNSTTSLNQLTGELGLSSAVAYCSYKQWRRGGPSAIGVRRRRPTVPRPKDAEVTRSIMRARLAEPANRDRYRRRAHLVETHNADRKQHRHGRWLTRRGLPAVNAEFLLDCLANNIIKARHALDAFTGALTGGWRAQP